MKVRALFVSRAVLLILAGCLPYSAKAASNETLHVGDLVVEGGETRVIEDTTIHIDAGRVLD